MADNTGRRPLCSSLLPPFCALVLFCLLIVATPTHTKPDYDGAYPRYSNAEIRRASVR